MALFGSNLRAKSWWAIRAKVLMALGLMQKMTVATEGDKDSPTSRPRVVAFLEKTGVPANSTAADAPTGLGDFCYDTTNKTVYICTSYTNSTTFTWTRIA